jgi:cytochrome c peroxidase
MRTLPLQTLGNPSSHRCLTRRPRTFGCLRQIVLNLAFASVSHGTVRAAPPAEPIQPIPLSLNQDPARVELGRRLFHDVRVSGNGRVSCASCHDLSQGGADGRARSPGLHGGLSEVNTPTVLNAALNAKQFWNGRANSLEEQIDQVVRNPVEMGATWELVVERVAQDAAYRQGFASAYRDGVTKANIQNAIASFERSLITPNSRFDKFLRGDANAISQPQKAGYAAFKRYGCVACHQGVNVGGNMFQKFGVMGDYFERRGNPSQADLGRFLATGKDSDRHVFKVPGLRNVALTAPYFHDASAKTLADAVDTMFRVQLGRSASAADKAAIVDFLTSLTGEQDARP